MSHKHSRSHHSETNSAQSIGIDEGSIRTRAYQLYEERGREDGRDLEDWLRAEAEIRGVGIGNPFLMRAQTLLQDILRQNQIDS